MTGSKSALVATVVVFILAVAAAVFAFWYIGGDSQSGGDIASIPDDDVFEPTADERAEMTDAADRLIKNNHRVVQLFLTQGLPALPEPYGNRPENDIYYVDSDEYLTLNDISTLVFDTFSGAEAERIMDGTTNFGNPFFRGAVYYDKDGSLGIHMNFQPYEDYPVNWTNPSYQLSPVSADECLLTLELSIDNQRATFVRTMSKRGNHWELDRIILNE
ncbi:MAG: hypothetical protein FWH20_00795 [Oscillospiraceae bacterium]|nr:hypothetical protein [Oscillospiraceae bacterium]